MENRLFLICPDAHLETIIPTHFSGQSYFMTALGADFSNTEMKSTATIMQLVKQAHITELCIVVDTYCRFIRSVVCKQAGYGTRAERTLQQLYQTNRKSLEAGRGAWNRCLALSKLHLLAQAGSFLQDEQLQTLLQKGQLKISLFLYYRNDDRMEAIRQPAERKPRHTTFRFERDALRPVATWVSAQTARYGRLALLFFTTLAFLLALYSDGLFMKELLSSAFMLTMLYALHHTGSDKRLT